jgi:hypothetical protein
MERVSRAPVHLADSGSRVELCMPTPARRPFWTPNVGANLLATRDVREIIEALGSNSRQAVNSLPYSDVT